MAIVREPTGRQSHLRRQQIVYLALALAAVALASLPGLSTDTYFRRYFGGADPILVILAVAALGAVALWLLHGSYGFVVFKGRDTIRGIRLSAAIATAFGVAIMIADLIHPYARDINVPLPAALLFYPSIGFVAEIIFHILPMALVLLLLTPFTARLGKERAVGAAIWLTALAEPSFQVLFGEALLSWSTAYTWIHIFLFALSQLYIFRRFDFASMLAFRLVYYLYWHILWGTARLELLF